MSESPRPQVGVIHSKIRYLGTTLFSAALVLILSKSLKWDRDGFVKENGCLKHLLNRAKRCIFIVDTKRR